MPPNKLRVSLTRFPGGEVEHPACTDWVLETVLNMTHDKRIREIVPQWIDGTPVTVSRNRAAWAAMQERCDILLIVDNDMGPDLDGPLKFWPRALDFMLSRWDECPTIVGAPYCGKPPTESVCVKLWRNRQGSNPSLDDVYLDSYKREEATLKSGYEPVAAIGTGLMAIDLRVLSGFRGVKLPPPWFYYEYTDPYQIKVASTEDITFTRNVQVMFRDIGPVVFVDWEAWAVHYKTKEVHRPRIPISGELNWLFEQAKNMPEGMKP